MDFFPLFAPHPPFHVRRASLEFRLSLKPIRRNPGNVAGVTGWVALVRPVQGIGLMVCAGLAGEESVRGNQLCHRNDCSKE